MRSTSIRVDTETHRDLKRLASDIGVTVGEAVAIAVRRLRQDRIGDQLAERLNDEESAWLDAELG